VTCYSKCYLRSTLGAGDRTQLRNRTTAQTQTLPAITLDKNLAKNMMDKYWYERRLDETKNQAIKDCYPKTWTEDEITTSLLKHLGDFLSKNKFNDSLTGQTTIKLTGYKYRGTQETKYGDIALLINIRFDNGIQFKGVGLLEAKKRIIDDYKYGKPSRKDQFSNILKNAPYASLLLYDYEPLTQIINPYSDMVDIRHYYYDDVYGHIPKTISPSNCVTCPLYLVRDDKEILRKITRSCNRLSEQLLNRYFHGLDLHTDQKSIKTLTDFDKNNSPRFVATVDITHGSTILGDNEFTIPDNLYRRIVNG
jgi:hypothetical protein